MLDFVEELPGYIPDFVRALRPLFVVRAAWGEGEEAHDAAGLSLLFFSPFQQIASWIGHRRFVFDIFGGLATSNTLDSGVQISEIQIKMLT